MPRALLHFALTLSLVLAMGRLSSPVFAGRQGDSAVADRQQTLQTEPPETYDAELRQNAEQGNAAAQFILGTMYHEGQTESRFFKAVQQDFAQAVLWYRKAADQGLASAQFNLGLMYGRGQGVPQDFVEAHKWINVAAARAAADDQKPYAEARDILEILMTREQLSEAQRRASEWMAEFEKRLK